ncbi:MAG: prohibitin family protein [Clostridia bacterium]|nr:prohibitin family protein [Clostridia bacterium]
MVLCVLSLIVLVIGIIAAIVVSKSQKAKKMLYIPIIIAVLGVVGVFASCVVSVPTGHTGVVITFGKVENYTFEAGVHVKLPFSDVINMDNRTQKGSEEMSCFSSDIQEVTATYTLNYRIEKSNAQTIYKTIGKDYYNTVVTPCIHESLKTVTAKYDAEDIIGSRAKLAKEVEDMLASKLKQYNIELVSTAIENLDFTDSFTQAVEDKQVAAQNKLKAQTEAEQKIIEAEAAAKAKIIAAEAEAKANDTIAKSLNDNILYQQWLEKWDGNLPQVAGSDANVIIDSLSPTKAAE